MNIIECKNLSKCYGKNRVLKNINLNIGKGKIIGLLGSNGSGKSTLIKLINDLLRPTQGEILINNEKPGIESKKIISYLPERTYLNLNNRVMDIISYFKDFYEDFDVDKVHSLLKTMNIDANDRLRTMSKGTKEKVQLALVMSRKADLYILDEPIGGVDPAGRDFIIETILSSFDENATLLICTHLIADIEMILDEAIIISNGEIIIHEQADKLREDRQKSIDAIFREDFRC